MGEVMREHRTAVMVLVEVSWKNQGDVAESFPGCVVDKSARGACVRLQRRVEVGSKLKIRGPREQFSGTAVYCNHDGNNYRVGIRRDETSGTSVDRLVPAAAAPRNDAGNAQAAVARTELPISGNRPENRSRLESTAERTAEPAPETRSVARATAMQPQAAAVETDSRDHPHASRVAYSDLPATTRPQTKRPPTDSEAGGERKHMLRKWFKPADWQTKRDEPLAQSGGNSEKASGAPQGTVPAEKAAPSLERPSHASFEFDLLPMEDIYRTAGIANSHRSYGITKVVKMLRSEHLNGLPGETRRAAVLMALDAAGVAVEDVLRDAKARQDALDSYEAQQRKQGEAEWARNDKENAQIVAELERLKTQYAARIGRNQDRATRQKAVFKTWLAQKQQEWQSIAEAVELCLKSTSNASEPAGAAVAEAGTVNPGAKQVDLAYRGLNRNRETPLA